MKKYLALFLSVVLMFSLAVPAMADEGTLVEELPEKIETELIPKDPLPEGGLTEAIPDEIIPGDEIIDEIPDEILPEEDTSYTLTLEGVQLRHTYTAYQIFRGDLHEGTLSNIVWGKDVTAEGRTALGNAAEKAASLKTVADAEAFAAEVAPYLGGKDSGSATLTSVDRDDPQLICTITGLEAGYYLIQTTATPEEYGVKTYYIMKVVGNTTATIKADVPKVEKKIVEGDQYLDETSANIGDEIIFTLTATMPSKLQGYETYKIVFHDTLSKGLNYIEIDSVTVDGKPVTEGYIASARPSKLNNLNNSTTLLSIEFENVLLLSAKENSRIVVTYRARLNSNAVIGSEGNPNTVYLEYSNDPNWDGNGTEPTGKTPEDKVKIYTWQLPIYKYAWFPGVEVDTPPMVMSALPLELDDLESEDPKEPMHKEGLGDVGFTLYKDGEPVQVYYPYPDPNYTPEVYVVCTKDSCSHEHLTESFTEGGGYLRFNGLEAGTYTLVETTVPAGYNKCEDITITIDENGKVYVNNDPEPVNRVEIENKAGSTLPETGGIGTTIFYTVGGVMVAAAAILLITKKRMSAEG